MHISIRRLPLAVALLLTLTGAAPKRPQIPTLGLRIPIGALTVVPENGTHVGVFSVFAISGAGGEEVSALRQQTQRFEIPPADLPKAMSGHFTYDLDLVLNEKADRVAVGVLDEVSKSFAVLSLRSPERASASRRAN